MRHALRCASQRPPCMRTVCVVQPTCGISTGTASLVSPSKRATHARKVREGKQHPAGVRYNEDAAVDRLGEFQHNSGYCVFQHPTLCVATKTRHLDRLSQLCEETVRYNSGCCVLLWAVGLQCASEVELLEGLMAAKRDRKRGARRKG